MCVLTHVDPTVRISLYKARQGQDSLELVRLVFGHRPGRSIPVVPTGGADPEELGSELCVVEIKLQYPLVTQREVELCPKPGF